MRIYFSTHLQILFSALLSIALCYCQKGLIPGTDRHEIELLGFACEMPLYVGRLVGVGDLLLFPGSRTLQLENAAHNALFNVKHSNGHQHRKERTQTDPSQHQVNELFNNPWSHDKLQKIIYIQWWPASIYPVLYTSLKCLFFCCFFSDDLSVHLHAAWVKIMGAMQQCKTDTLGKPKLA